MTKMAFMRILGKSMRITSFAKTSEKKRMIVARFSVKNIERGIGEIIGEKSMMNLLTTRRTIAKSPKRYNKIINLQTMYSFQEGISM